MSDVFGDRTCRTRRSQSSPVPLRWLRTNRTMGIMLGRPQQLIMRSGGKYLQGWVGNQQKDQNTTKNQTPSRDQQFHVWVFNDRMMDLGGLHLRSTHVYVFSVPFVWNGWSMAPTRAPWSEVSLTLERVDSLLEASCHPYRR